MEMCQDLTERFMFRQPHEKTITFTTVILQFRIHVLLLRESVLFELCCKTLTCQRVNVSNMSTVSELLPLVLPIYFLVLWVLSDALVQSCITFLIFLKKQVGVSRHWGTNTAPFGWELNTITNSLHCVFVLGISPVWS